MNLWDSRRCMYVGHVFYFSVNLSQPIRLTNIQWPYILPDLRADFLAGSYLAICWQVVQTAVKEEQIQVCQISRCLENLLQKTFSISKFPDLSVKHLYLNFLKTDDINIKHKICRKKHMYSSSIYSMKTMCVPYVIPKGAGLKSASPT